MAINGDRMREIARRANDGARAAANAMAEAGQAEIRRQLGRRQHPPRTSTPAPPGAPPARVTGRLQRSVLPTPAAPFGAYRWVATVGPRGVVYARIQATGGVIRPRRARFLVFTLDGRVIFARQVRLPARPYLPPARNALRASGQLHRIAGEAFRREVHGG